MTEEVTFIAEGFERSRRSNARRYFSDHLIMQAIILVAMIIAWNRNAMRWSTYAEVTKNQRTQSTTKCQMNLER